MSGTPEELRRASEGYRAYFGTSTVDSAPGVLIHQVEGDSRGLYTGTRQRRQYRLAGDILFIGNDTTVRRVLVRVREDELALPPHNPHLYLATAGAHAKRHVLPVVSETRALGGCCASERIPSHGTDDARDRNRYLSAAVD
jgi:hypothetical protein